ncbi:MAG: sigma 54-interacting transcriptional regulator [Planctomycetales bacterium]|nr:sigma 54-interacting transcriptional regulator [Planctomycetales bacterium]
MQQTSPQAYLIIQLGNRWTDILRLQPDQAVYVGRSSENQVVVRDERVSRQHAHIYALDGRWEVRDLGSRNGTQVDGQSIDGGHRLSEGETIGVGGCRMTFSHSLSGGFAVQQSLSSEHLEESLEGQQTVDIDARPTILQRRSNSQWSAEMLQPPPARAGSSLRTASLTAGRSPSPSRAQKWSFFYRLVFDLVACHSPEEASQVALDRLLGELGISAGGIVAINDPPAATSDPQPAAGQQAAAPLPSMAVLAARQPTGASYQRVSDFLVRTVMAERQAVLARNVGDDSNLSMDRQSARRDIVSVICAPLRDRETAGEPVHGLLHVYSWGEERMLSESDLELAMGVADNLAIALARQRDKEQLTRSLAHSRRQIDHLQEQLQLSSTMVGKSTGLLQVQREIQRAAPTAATVLVRGESGVGKELVARAIHQASPRKDGPLVCLNCAALAPTLLESELFGHEKGAFTGATERKIGKFEAASGGTLLLDEIGEMHSELQAKFLRVLEGQPFERLGGHKPIVTDVRVIAATNRNLEEAVQAKEFRSDLYYRLRVIEIFVPPLRQRPDDIPLLVEAFINQLRHHASRRLSGIEPRALELLSRHTWPGNVRELRNVIERAIVLGSGETLGVDDFRLSSLGQQPGDTAFAAEQPFQPLSLAELEKAHILAMLEHTQGNKTQAAQLLGIERSTLDRKLKRYAR